MANIQSLFSKSKYFVHKMKKYFQKPFTFFIFKYRIYTKNLQGLYYNSKKQFNELCLDIDEYRVSYILFNENMGLEEELI